MSDCCKKSHHTHHDHKHAHHQPCHDHNRADHSCHRDSCEHNDCCYHQPAVGPCGKSCCDNDTRAACESAGTTCSCCGGSKSARAMELALPFIFISLASIVASFGISHFGFNFPGFPLSDPAWVAVILCGVPIIREGFTNFFVKKKITSALLVSVAIFASLGLQFFITFSGVSGDMHGHDSYIFAAGEIAFLMALGEWLEDRTVKKARAGVENLIKITPKKALLVRDNGETEEVPVEQLRVGDRVRVRPSDSIPADGEVVEGASSVDQSSMTGESLPVDKAAGDAVFAGTQNLSGSLLIRVSKRSGDSAISRLIEYVKNAEQRKAPIQRTADKWAAKIVPAAIICAILVFLLSFFILDVGTKESVKRGVTILVVFCPCAFALATPTAIAAGIGNAARNGILIKSGDALEKLCSIKKVVFDKTGTLTKAELRVEKILATGKFSDEKLLKFCAAAERHSQHPIAKAITDEEKKRFGGDGNAQVVAKNVAAKNGVGISCEIDGAKIDICSRRAFEASGMAFSREMKDFVAARSAAGEIPVIVAADGALAGIITLSDTLKEEAATTISALKTGGYRTVMLTGDNASAAKSFGARVGVDEIFSEQLPEGKATTIATLRDGGKSPVLMVGDGVNDAPALVSADCSVAMGALGSELAVETAEIALLNDKILLVPVLLKFAKSVLRTIHCNFVISICINSAAVVLSASGILDPVSGAFVHNASSLIVVLNSASLLARKLQQSK